MAERFGYSGYHDNGCSNDDYFGENYDFEYDHNHDYDFFRNTDYYCGPAGTEPMGTVRRCWLDRTHGLRSRNDMHRPKSILFPMSVKYKELPETREIRQHGDMPL